MATLIQSKQIEGVVTASVITGDFRVSSGSVDLTTANGVTGSFSGSFVGDGTGLTINYSQLQGKPNFVAGTGIAITQVGTNITITNTGGGGGVSGSAELLNSVAQLNAYTASNDIIINGINQTTASLQSQINALVSATSSYLTTDNTGSDSQTLSIVGDQLTISGGNTITIPTGSGGGGTSDFTQLTNVPSGLVSSSEQILGGSGIVSGSVLRTLDGTGVLSGSKTDITLLNQFSESIQSQVDALISATSSYLTSETDSQTLSIVGNQLTISSGNTITIPTGSGGVETDITLLNQFTQSIQSQVDSLTSATSSYLTQLPSGLVSGSVLRTFDGTGVVSGSVLRTLDGTGVLSGSIVTDLSSSLDSRISVLESQTDLTGSDSQTLSLVGDQLTISGGNTVTLPSGGGGTSDFTQLTNVPSGLVSSSAQTIANLGGSGILSGSHTDITSLNQFTQSADQRLTDLENFSSSLDTTFATDSELSSLSSSIATTIDNIQHTQIPSGTISGSSQVDFTQISNVPSGLVSGSVLRTLGGTNVLSGSILPGTNVTIDSSSGDYVISSLGGGSVPSGTISSSQQISDLGYVTSSLEAPFNGNRVVSNTLLGELFSQSFNAGTTGSLAQFIEQVFFPTEAPTATFTNQTAKFNTNLATNNTNLVSVSLTDTVDNSPYTLVLSGTNASSLTAVPTNSESSSWEIRANGNLTAGTYSYDVTVGDSTNSERTYSGRSITIAQATTGTLSTNGPLYIIESATSGVITLSTSGRPGSAGSVLVSYSPNYGTQVATNFSSSNPLISINSTNGQLSVGSPISGSGNLAGSTITSNITYNDQYGNNGSGSISVTVTQNNAPDIVFTNSSLLNTNQATGSSGTLVTISFTDTEGDSINHDSFTFTETSGQLQSTRSGNNYLVTATSDLSASNYTITCSVEDIHGFRTNTETHTFSIAQASSGTLTGDTSIYIIESATNGDSFRDATGFGNGNLAQIGVSYSPNYGSQVATLTSSNPAIVVDGSGNLTLGVDLSGSVTQSGDTFSSTISWSDQYGNSSSGTVTATVFANQAPAASFVDNGLTDVTAISGSNIGTLTVTDVENNSPFVVTLGGTDGGKFDVSGTSSPFQIQPTGSLSIGTYSIQLTVTDTYGKQATLNEDIVVSSDSDFGKVYVYTNNRGLTAVDDNYLGVLAGINTINGDTPPEITSYSNNSIIDYFAGNLGSSEIDMGSGFNLTRRLLTSGSDLTQLLSGSDSFTVNPNEQILIIFPSGSDMVGIPTSIAQAFGGSTVGEYVLNINTGAGWSGTIEGANIHSFQTDTSVNGYNEYFIIGTTVEGGVGGTVELRLTPSSGSAPV